MPSDTHWWMEFVAPIVEAIPCLIGFGLALVVVAFGWDQIGQGWGR